ncbi:Hydrophobin-like protein ssgA [Metarhizium anisopliae]|nr:Hydrophobin-like protein ssgA [Metarhizium anisopliae]
MFKALIVALAAVAAAIPTQQPSSNVITCDNSVHCCNKAAQNTGLVVPLDALSPTCGKLADVFVIDALNPTCNGQTVCCNNVQQNVSIQDQLSRKSITNLTKWYLQGVVNVACTPVSA